MLVIAFVVGLAGYTTLPEGARNEAAAAVVEPSEIWTN